MGSGSQCLLSRTQTTGGTNPAQSAADRDGAETVQRSGGIRDMKNLVSNVLNDDQRNRLLKALTHILRRCGFCTISIAFGAWTSSVK